MLKSVQTLLTSIVDYAGLFPPARLGLRQAMENYAQYGISADAWLLGWFVLPLSQLDEFKGLLPEIPLKHWHLSLILPTEVEVAISRLQSCKIPEITIATLELPPLSPTQIEQVGLRLPADVETFFEIPLGTDWQPYFAALKRVGAAAKVRMGGITVDAFPTAAELSCWIVSCAEAGVPFKATAGLHHPLPACHPVTYKSDRPSAAMQGFLNVAIASSLVYRQKITLEDTLEVLNQSSIEGFQFTEDSLSWHQYSLSLSDLEETRRQFFRSFGSCSFQEPIDDLRCLQLL